jgi:hypothetical protein
MHQKWMERELVLVGPADTYLKEVILHGIVEPAKPIPRALFVTLVSEIQIMTITKFTFIVQHLEDAVIVEMPKPGRWKDAAMHTNR